MFNSDVSSHAKDVERCRETGQDLVDAHPELKNDVEKTVGKIIP